MVECTPINVMLLYCWPMTPHSSYGYPMITYTHPPSRQFLYKKTLVARQLPTHTHTHTHTHTCTNTNTHITLTHIAHRVIVTFARSCQNTIDYSKVYLEFALFRLCQSSMTRCLTINISLTFHEQVVQLVK